MIHPSSYGTNVYVKNDILSALAYFDIFDYPLKRREITLFLPNNYQELHINNALDELLTTSAIFRLGEFFSLRDNHELEQRRNKGNEKAAGMMATAEKIGLMLSKFPYVRGIAISGSLSKNFADENSDIDLFIITGKNRLWIARTLLRMFVKLAYPAEKQHLFCMNYFIDEHGLEIQEKNIYTATEIVTLIPLQGSMSFQNFFIANRWTKNFFPNNHLSISSAKTIKPGWYKRIIESLLNNPLGNMLDTLLMNITSKRWRKIKEQNFLNKNGLLFSVITGKHFAKHDPDILQKKVITLHTNRRDEIINKVKLQHLQSCIISIR